MSKENKIEEMAAFLWYNTLITDMDLCDDVAEALYNAGYRKQGEGEWVDKYNGKYANQLYKCSVCGSTAHSDDRGHWFLTPYCPSCGAKMGGGAK